MAKGFLEVDYPRISDPHKFELMCRDLWAEVWKDTNTTLHGRSGQKQMGVDVYGIDKSKDKSNKDYSGIQSKKRNGKLFGKPDLSEKEIVSEVEDALKFDTGGSDKLAQLIIATTQQTDKEYQKLARKLTKRYDFDVHIVGWQDITHLLSKYEEVARDYYPGHFPPEDLELKAVKALASSGTNAQLSLAKDYIDEGNHLAALKVLATLEKSGMASLSEEEKFKLYTNLAIAHSYSGRNDEALRYLRKANGIEFDSDIAYRNKITILLDDEKLDEALDLIDEGLKKYKGSSLLRVLRIQAQYDKGEDLDSILSQYRDLSKSHEDIAFQLSQVAAQAQMRGEAIKILETHRSVKENEFSHEHIKAMAFLASLYIEDVTSKNNYMLGHFNDGSIELLRRAKELLDYVIKMVDGRQVKALYADIFSRRSVIHEIEGDSFEAIADAKQAYELDNSNDQVAANYAMLLMDNGRLQEAHTVLQKDPGSLGHVLLDGMAYGKENNHSQEDACFEKVIRESEKNEQRIVAYNAYIQSLIRREGHDEALSLIARYEEAYSISAESLNYRAIIAEKVGDSESTVIDYLSKAGSLIKQDTLREVIGGIGARLEDYKQHEKAIEVLGGIVTTNTYDVLLEKYLVALWEQRRLSDAELLCKEAIKKHGAKPLLVDILFNIAMQKSDYDEGVKLLEEFAAQSESKEYIIKLAMLHLEKNQKQRAEAIINELISDNLSDWDALGVAQVLVDIGRKEEAIKILYAAILANRNMPELQQAYISIIFMAANEVKFEAADEIQAGCAVTLETNNGSALRTVVIEEDKRQEDIGQNHYSKNHAVAQQLLGSKVNDKVVVADNDYVVKSLSSKYLHLFALLRDTYSENFPENQFMWKVKVQDENGNFDITKIQDSLGQQEKRSRQITDNIEKAIFPLPAAAKISGKSYIDIIYAHMADSDHFIPSSTLMDFPNTMPAVITLDLSACITLCESEIDLPELEGTRYVMPISSLKILAAKIKDLEDTDKRDSEASVMYTENGKLRILKSTKASIKSNIDLVKKLRKWIKVNVECIPLSKPDSLNGDEYKKVEDILGGAWADVVTEAKAHVTSGVLVSEDLALRKLLRAEQNQISTANSQQLVDHLRKIGEVSNQDYLNHVRKLAENGYRHTYINVEDLIDAFTLNSLRLDEKTQAYINIFEDSSIDSMSAIGVALHFLYQYWKTPGSQLYWNNVSNAVLAALLKRKDRRENSHLIELAILKIFYIIPNIAAELAQTKKDIESSFQTNS